VEISFDDAQMAALCNSRRHLTARWGGQGFILVARNLELLAAIDGNDVVDLPTVVVQLKDDGAVTMTFDQGRLTIEAMPTKGSEKTDELDNADGIRIMSVIVGSLK
jgi:hypothetical protein